MKTLMKLLLLGFAALLLLGFVVVSPEHRGHGPRRAHEHHRRVSHDRRQVNAPETRQVAGRVSATLDRAKEDARRRLDAEIREWLAPDAATSWTPPAALVDAMVEQVRVAPEEKDYGTVYTAVIDADFGGGHRARLVDAYRRDVTRDRTMKLAATLGFVLVCLGAVSGYIRADEATRGYYTNRLRLAAAAAVGASGVALYQFLA
ncbi:hypothetical protein [Paludisphaera sp.]|uniref:hypothetical protein n=1 Tax=Paludisphaera sp. TaxID=2017432 RepID=UPI00301E0A8F